ncbi:hypothetical protein, partial [Rhizobium hidalgonense]|uniref:hypothetical protein n=1 Tax=Rhizobium hidalgonense TaxID=1538159 RepID=UPI0019D4539F
MDADYPAKGVKFARRNTAMLGSPVLVIRFLNLNRPWASTVQFAILSRRSDIAEPDGAPSHRYRCRRATTHVDA